MPDPLPTLLATIERLDREATREPWTVSKTAGDLGWAPAGSAQVRADGVGHTNCLIPFGIVHERDAAAIAFSRNTLAPLASMLRVAVEALEFYDVLGDSGARARAALATIRRMAEEVTP